MNPVTKVVIACTVVGVSLYFLVSQFLLKSEEITDSLDVRSLAHTRSMESQAMTREPLADQPVSESRSADSKSVSRSDESGLSVARDPQEQVSEDDAVPLEETDDDSQPLPPIAAAVQSEAATNDAEPQEFPSVDTDELASADESNVTGTPVESSAEARLKAALGIRKPEPAIRAVDVLYELPANCEASGVAAAPVTVQYRYESATIKGNSLRELEVLMAEYRRCEGGVFRLAHNPLGKEDATALLRQMRLDELKYFFLQHRVPKAALRYPDNS